MTYTIKEGHHYSGFTIDRLCPCVSLRQSGTFAIDLSCWYPKWELTDHGWHKLTGIGSAIGMHTRSGRLVWQPNFTDKYTFDIAGYVHRGSSNIWEAKYITTVECGISHQFVVKYRSGMWYFRVGNAIIEMPGEKPIFPIRAYPYFGGKSVAPWDMYINVR